MVCLFGLLAHALESLVSMILVQFMGVRDHNLFMSLVFRMFVLVIRQVREGKVDRQEVPAQTLTEYADPLRENSRSQKLTLSSFRDFNYGNGYSRSDKDKSHNKGRDIKLSHNKPPVEYADPLTLAASRQDLTLSSLKSFSYDHADRTSKAAHVPTKAPNIKPNVYEKKYGRSSSFSAGGPSSSAATNDFMHFKSHDLEDIVDFEDSSDFGKDNVSAAQIETKKPNLHKMYVF